MPRSPEQLRLNAVDEWRTIAEATRALAPDLARLCALCRTCWDGGGKLLVCGNGGSAADAMHLAEELVARFDRARPPLAAIALLDPTTLTCAANDFGFEQVFARQVEALARPGDVLVVLSTSGNSPNVLAAVDAAEAAGVPVAAFLGKGGGTLAGRCAVELVAPADSSHRVQEVHKLLFHTFCAWADAYALGEG